MSTVRRSGKAIIDDLQATGRVLADFLHRTYSVKRARIVLAVALNFCLLYAIGLGTIDAAVRLRNCDGALASRIRALSLTLNIHSFTSPRAGTFRTDICTTRATSLGRKADKGQARLRSVSEILQRQRCHDTTVNDSPALPDESLPHTRTHLGARIR